MEPLATQQEHVVITSGSVVTMAVAMLSELDESTTAAFQAALAAQELSIERADLDHVHRAARTVVVLTSPAAEEPAGGPMTDFIAAAVSADREIVVVSLGDAACYTSHLGCRHVSISDTSADAASKVVHVLGTQAEDPGQGALASDPQEEAEKTVVFMSYRRLDERFMNQIRVELEGRGYKVWWDKARSGIPAATFWPSSVEEAIAAADAFIVLISPNVLDDPRRVQTELYLAHTSDKKIIAVDVKTTDKLPAGWELMLSGRQRVDLHRRFSEGMFQICEALGPVEIATTSHAGARGTLKSGWRSVRRISRDPDVRAKAKTITATAVSIAATAAAAYAAAEQRNANKNRDTYLDDMYKLLNQSLVQMKFATPSLFDPDFQVRFQNILGRIEATRPPPKFERKHRELVDALKKFSAQFDALCSKARAGDEAGAELALERLSTDWNDVIRTNVEWFDQAISSQ